MTFKPELFDGACDSRLPIATVVDRYDIGLLLPLNTTLDALLVPMVLSPSFGRLDNGLPEGLLRRADGSVMNYFAATGGVSVDDVASGQMANALQPLVSSIEIPSAIDVLSEGKVVVDGEELVLDVTGNLGRSLLAGRATLATARATDGSRRRVRLVARPPMPTLEKLLLRDVAAFLARPEITLPDGSIFPVELPAERRRELLTSGKTMLTLAGSSVELESVGTASQQSAILTAPAPPVATTWSGAGVQPPPGQAIPIPSGPHLTAFPLAIFIPVRQEWELLGYSRGALLHSIALAPQEEVTLEVRSWDKTTTTSETTTSTELTASGESSDTTRDTRDILNETARTSELRNNGTGTLGYSGYGFSINLNGGLTDENQVTDTTRLATSRLHEQVVKASTQVKTTRQTKVGITSDSGREEKVTRRIRNPNMCHTLAIDSFEILVHYQLTTAVVRSDAVPCVLIEIPLPSGPFRRSDLREHETVLTNALLERALLGGFPAARLLEVRDYACSLACERCSCGSDPTVLPAAAMTALQSLRDAAQRLRAANIDQALYWVWGSVDGQGANSTLVSFDPGPFADTLYMWIFVRALSLEGQGWFEVIVDPGTINDADAYAAGQRVLTALGGDRPDELDPTWLVQRWRSRIEGAIYARYVSLYGVPPGAQGSVIQTINSWWGIRGRDAGFVSALQQFYSAMKAPAPSVRTDRDPLQAAYGLTDVAAARERETALLAHLNQCADYYRARIFLSLPIEVQRDLLRSRGYDFPGLELRPVGREGRALAYPVRALLSPRAQSLFDRVLWSNVALGEVYSSDKVLLPTTGIDLQTRVGECDACEPYIQKIRDVDVRKRNAEADALEAKAVQEQLEAERLKARLDPAPMLDDPFRPQLPALQVEVTNSPASPVTEP